MAASIDRNVRLFPKESYGEGNLFFSPIHLLSPTSSYIFNLPFEWFDNNFDLEREVVLELDSARYKLLQ